MPPAHDMTDVPALILAPGAAPVRMNVPQHAHRIECACGASYDRSAPLSRLFQCEVFVPEGLTEMTFSIAVHDPLPTETLPASLPVPLQLQPPPRHVQAAN